MIICQELGCKYFNSSHKDSGGYGCQRWSSSSVCMINSLPEIRHNEYALYADELTNDMMVMYERFVQVDNFEA